MEEENVRRAEDDPRWKSYVNDHINWKKSFETLGEAFTVRILLRRELFEEIETWLMDSSDASGEDLGAILHDCEVTLQSLKHKDAPAEIIAKMTRIVGKIREKGK